MISGIYEGIFGPQNLFLFKISYVAIQPLLTILPMLTFSYP
jgi:hypothetical protein